MPVGTLEAGQRGWSLLSLCKGQHCSRYQGTWGWQQVWLLVELSKARLAFGISASIPSQGQWSSRAAGGPVPALTLLHY